MTLSHTVGPTCADESKKPGVKSLKPFLPLQLQGARWSNYYYTCLWVFVANLVGKSINFEILDIFNIQIYVRIKFQHAIYFRNIHSFFIRIMILIERQWFGHFFVRIISLSKTQSDPYTLYFSKNKDHWLFYSWGSTFKELKWGIWPLFENDP